MFMLNGKGGAGRRSGGRAAGNPQGCPGSVHGSGVGKARQRLVHAVALTAALAAGQASAATDGPALAQRAAEFVKQELQRQFERDAWQRQREIEQRQYERIDALEARQRREEADWRSDMQGWQKPIPQTRYRKPF